MVKVTKISLDSVKKEATVDLFSDTKAEMDSVEPVDIIGFPDDYTIGFGSSVFTASGDLAFIQSDGTWNWGEE